MKASIGLRTHFSFFTLGIPESAGGENDQCRFFSFLLPSAGHTAPSSIQRLIKLISDSDRRGPFFGIIRSGSAPLINWTIRLSLLFPGIIAGTESPPSKADFRSSHLKEALS